MVLLCANCTAHYKDTLANATILRYEDRNLIHKDDTISVFSNKINDSIYLSQQHITKYRLGNRHNQDQRRLISMTADINYIMHASNAQALSLRTIGFPILFEEASEHDSLARFLIMLQYTNSRCMLVSKSITFYYTKYINIKKFLYSLKTPPLEGTSLPNIFIV